MALYKSVYYYYEWWGAGMVICLELGADLHMAQLMLLPFTVSFFNKIQIGFTFLVPADPGSPGKRAVKRVCVCIIIIIITFVLECMFSTTGLVAISKRSSISAEKLHRVTFIHDNSKFIQC